jgi:hypothetical protein
MIATPGMDQLTPHHPSDSQKGSKRSPSDGAVVGGLSGGQ